ncbi:Transcription initiation factor IIA subunit 1 [Zea mays]|uniref:Transcription initiation factor IIA subunit 1 n=1 Tax=Zea mays TaxID=4577 RepID=A0A3L6DNC3_MAIZE|nr:Transcription initiation factor IIA subunit 1 [Zea mays]
MQTYLYSVLNSRVSRPSPLLRNPFPSSAEASPPAAETLASAAAVMASSNVSTVYISVIDDVISKVREDFITYGVGDAVLNELQALWEMKMLHCGAISGNIDRTKVAAASVGGTTGTTPPVHDLNVPYEATSEEYATPTADMLFPPTPLQTPIQTPLPGTDTAMYNIPTGPSDYAPSPISDVRNGMAINGADPTAGHPSPYMPPPSPWMNQRPLGVDVNVAYVEGREDPDRGVQPQPLTQDFLMMSSGKRKRDEYPGQLPSGSFVPQQDGSADQIVEFVVSKENANQLWSSIGNKLETPTKTITPVIPQRDGIQDNYNDQFFFSGVPTEDYNTPGESAEYRAPTPAVGTPKQRNDAGDDDNDDDDDEPPLNEDDDEELDDLEQGEDEPNTQHLVLAQFDKVSRTKNRWKCTLKDGIMHLNGRDVLFNKVGDR